MIQGVDDLSNLRRIGALSELSARQVGARIRSVRKAKGITVKDLAAAIGIRESTAYELFRGRKDPSLGELIRAAHALGIHSIEELIAPLGTADLLRNEFGPDAAI